MIETKTDILHVPDKTNLTLQGYCTDIGEYRPEME